MVLNYYKRIQIFFRYYNVVSLVDLFRYSNMYVCTTKIGELARNKNKHDEAVNTISRPSILIKLYNISLMNVC